MAEETALLSTTSLHVLDLCMAPGGFSATVKKKIPGSLIDALTLPPEIGGYEVLARKSCQRIIFADITMYISEMGLDEGIPTGHPDSGKFETGRPYLDNQYDLIFCGGAVVKTHPREEYRDSCEGSRLTLSQLVFALNRLKPGGSLVLLLHRVEAWDTVCILNAFNRFSDIQLFKSPRQHAVKSSFYLVARNIDLDHEVAAHSISYWKDHWKYLTFKEFKDVPQSPSRLFENNTDAFAHELKNEFGSRFLEIARPLWEIQANALRQFIKSK